MYLDFYVCNLSVIVAFLHVYELCFYKVCCCVIDYVDLNTGYAGNKLIKVIICNISHQMTPPI